MLVDFNMARKRRGDRLGRGFFVPCARGWLRAGGCDFFGEIADLGVLRRLQATDLALQRTNAGDLADAGRDAEKQRVARDIESACREIPLIGVGLHVVGAREFLGQVLQNRAVNLKVGVEKLLPGCGVCRGRFTSKIGRRHET